MSMAPTIMSELKDLTSPDLVKVADVLRQLAQEVEDGCAQIRSMQFTIHPDELPRLTLDIIGTGKHEEDLMPYMVRRNK